MPPLKAYAEYLQSQRWDAVVTVTFKNHQRYARKALELSVREIRPFNKLFLAAEEHLLGGYHCHGLIEWNDRDTALFDGKFVRTSKHLDLNRLGFNRVDHIRNAKAVSAYCTKHVVKSMTDYEFFGRPDAWA